MNYFYINSESEAYINELAKLLSLDPGNLYRKLKELESMGLLTSKYFGNVKLYSLNKKFPLFEEYRSIFQKQYGLDAMLKESLKKLKGLKQAYLFGSIVSEKFSSHSDIDLLLVGNHSPLEAQKAIMKLQTNLKREINIVNLSQTELKLKKESDPFLIHIFKNIRKII